MSFLSTLKYVCFIVTAIVFVLATYFVYVVLIQVVHLILAALLISGISYLGFKAYRKFSS